MNAATAIADTHAEMQLENAERFEAALREAVAYMPDNYSYAMESELIDQAGKASLCVQELREQLGLTASSSERT